MHRLVWTFAGQLYLIILCSWAMETLAKLHICKDSSEPSLANCTSSFCVVKQWKLWRDCTYAQTHLNLRWPTVPHNFVKLSNGNSGETAHMHRLIWTFAGQLYLIILCSWAVKALVRLHICTDSSEPSLANCTSSFCEVEQWKLWWDYTYAQTHLNLRWPTVPHNFV